MGGRARLARATLGALIVTALRRPFRGPLRPSWSFAYEVAVRALRGFLAGVIHHSPAKLRAAWEDVAAPGVRGVVRQSVRIGDQAAEWFGPPGVAASARVVLYLHGGAYVWGSSRTHADLISRIAVAAGARVLAPDYRLAPEHPCPAAHDDAVAAYRWLLAQGVAAREIVVAGDSAGGNLALSLLGRLRAEGLPMPRGMALLCPWVDLSRQGGSVASNAAFDWIGSDGLRRWMRTYHPSERYEEALVSPLFADLRGLPPALVQVGGAEVLLDQVLELGKALVRAGVPATVTVYPDMVHDWHVLSGFAPEALQAITEIGRFVRDPEAVTASRGG